jgi:hypothetical protein
VNLYRIRPRGGANRLIIRVNRRARSAAAERGIPLRELVTQALAEKLQAGTRQDKPWLKSFGKLRTPDVGLQFLPGGENGLSHSFRWRELRRAHCKFHDIRSSETARPAQRNHTHQSDRPGGIWPDRACGLALISDTAIL